MSNILYLIGKVAAQPKVIEDGDNKKILLKISVTRAYKNSEGVYECDIFPVELAFSNHDMIIENLHKNDLVEIKSNLIIKNNNIAIVCEKFTFLSSKADDKNDK